MTMDSGTLEKVAAVAGRLAAGGRNVVFTGAGISTESGIPDYRSKGGIWDQYRPVYFDEFMSDRRARVTYWQQKTEMYRDLVKARPNPAHMALLRLREMGLLEAVITQNIDNLHQMSGLPDEAIVELHGNTRRIRCMSCGAISPEAEAQARVEAGDPAPECACGGYLKPDTVSFGQSMPEAELRRAVALSQSADVFLVVGSTLLVQPAAGMPAHARGAGAWLAIVNMSDTPCDRMADVLIHEKAGVVLPAIVAEVARLRGAGG